MLLPAIAVTQFVRSPFSTLSLYFSFFLVLLSALSLSGSLFFSLLHCSDRVHPHDVFVDAYCYSMPNTSFTAVPLRSVTVPSVTTSPAMDSFLFPYALLVCSCASLLHLLRRRHHEMGRLQQLDSSIQRAMQQGSRIDGVVDNFVDYILSVRGVFGHYHRARSASHALSIVSHSSISYFFFRYYCDSSIFEVFRVLESRFPLKFTCLISYSGASGTAQLYDYVCILPSNYVYRYLVLIVLVCAAIVAIHSFYLLFFSLLYSLSALYRANFLRRIAPAISNYSATLFIQHVDVSTAYIVTQLFRCSDPVVLNLIVSRCVMQLSERAVHV